MKKQTQIRIIYARYIMPPILLLLTILSMLIPSYRYVINGELAGAVSALRLMADAFEQARQVIFSSAEQDASNVLFSSTVMVIILISLLLLLICVAATLYSSFMALRYFRADDTVALEKSRALFITLIPNRTVLCFLQLLCIPITVFPYIMPPLFKAIWSERIGLALIAPDALIMALISLMAIFALCIVSSFYEHRIDRDIFKKRKDFEHDRSLDGEYFVEDAPQRKLSDEQNEIIRRILLGGDGENENKDNTED